MSQHARLKTLSEFDVIETHLSVVLGANQGFSLNGSTRHIALSSFDHRQQSAFEREKHDEAAQTDDLKSSCLVLESNIVICIDLEEILKAHGVGHIDHACSVAEAVRFLEQRSYEFAVIDFDPGIGNFEVVIEKLASRGIHFAAIVCGADETGFLGKSRDVPLIIKPFSSADVASALTVLEAGGKI
jgi:hypothetical protein